tara:strand:- start:989 stop:1501 length:513 start_codon:yes stop_codon:yes gene_type:complete
MKSFKKFIKEQPTNVTGGVAKFDKYLFPIDDDTLTQDYQTPYGLNYRLSNIFPVEKLTLQDIDTMTGASKKYVNMQDDNARQRTMKNYSQFMEETKSKDCPPGKYYCFTDKKCKSIPKGYYVGARGRLAQEPEDGDNDNGNGSNNGVDSGNGNGHSNGGGNGHGSNGGGS